ECENYQRVIARSAEIEAAYAAWQQARQDLERWEGVAAQFREHEKRRQGPLDEINAARARLAHELEALLKQQNLILAVSLEFKDLNLQLEVARQELDLAEKELGRRVQLDLDLQTARQRQAEARAENPRLKAEMDELKERIDRLGEVEGADCPLCGQPLQPEDRQRLMDELTLKGKEMGDRYRANLALVRESDRLVQDLERQIAALALAEANARAQTRRIDQINGRLEIIQNLNADWESREAPRMQLIQGELAEETFAPEARTRLAEIDAELKAIGYDAATHDAARKAELKGRLSEESLRELERARAALAPIEREINELESQIVTQQAEVKRQQFDHDQAAASLAAAKSQAPDLYAAEKAWMKSQEEENRVRMEVGAAQQKVLVLDDLKQRRKSLNIHREEQARLVGRYKQLERAFGKDGVPALLIEQAMPEIERKANEILDRLSGGTMSVRFLTQAAYKDKHREDLRETLDILISDGVGTRDYETYSGGENFRVNFAIRLALSEVLAQRAGARLQTLVIDEGFGSQDAIGRQRLIEAINSFRQDFSKILVISHLDELKDAFPNRIEVEKTDRGSTVKVI
ncbi:MAG: SbcC/MukB-like Walker B domain-containing protein, partial [Omnitrophica WOR_2 bacterium]